MRTRTKQPPTIVSRLISIPDSAMVIVRDLEKELGGDQLNGAYVKVQPTLRASERASFDIKAIRTRLLAAGAVAVVSAPVVLPDARDGVLEADKAPTQHVTPEQHLRAWFETASASRKVVDKALKEALDSVHGAGL